MTDTPSSSYVADPVVVDHVLVPLAAYLRKHLRLTPVDAIRIARGVAAGIGYIHSNDIKNTVVNLKSVLVEVDVSVSHGIIIVLFKRLGSRHIHKDNITESYERGGQDFGKSSTRCSACTKLGSKFYSSFKERFPVLPHRPSTCRVNARARHLTYKRPFYHHWSGAGVA